MNMVMPMELEMEITFGTAFTDLCIWILNLRISYPDEDIFLAFWTFHPAFASSGSFPILSELSVSLWDQFSLRLIGSVWQRSFSKLLGTIPSSVWQQRSFGKRLGTIPSSHRGPCGCIFLLP